MREVSHIVLPVVAQKQSVCQYVLSRVGMRPLRIGAFIKATIK